MNHIRTNFGRIYRIGKEFFEQGMGWGHAVFIQKLDYIHRNPARAGLGRFPEDDEFSSARFYETGLDNRGFLTHYLD